MLLWLLKLAVEVYFWIVIFTVVLDWLVNLNIVNGYRPEVRAVRKVCYQMTEPLLAPIRKRIPPIGGLDISPLVLVLGLQFGIVLIDKIFREVLI